MTAAAPSARSRTHLNKESRTAMKAVTEALSPTRVKLTVEVPFEELRPSLDAAYKKLAGQVKVQGFRPGKVPPRILDQRLGRATILDEALQDAVPRFYSTAVSENDVEVLGQPSVDVTSFSDGDPLVFTAEVDIRPEFELPDYEGLAVTVDDMAVTDEELAEQIDALRERFAVLEGVDRPVETGDFVSIDLEASIDGEPVPDAQTTGLSYEVGTDALIPGLDEQLVGMAEGAAGTFTSHLVAGDHEGQEAQATVTVRSVKHKVLPALDDEFATTASEFDTLEELRADVRGRFERVKRLQQGMAARDKVLETLLGLVEVPLPETAVTAEVEARMHNLGHQLENAGLTIEGYLDHEEQSREAFDAEIRANSETAVKSTLVLEAVARKEQIGVTDAEVSQQLVRRAQQAGMEPQTYADRLVQAGQVQALVSDIVRGKALALVISAATITDASGNAVDLDRLAEDGGVLPPDVAQLAGQQDHEGQDHEGHDHEGHDHEGHDHGDHDHGDDQA